MKPRKNLNFSPDVWVVEWSESQKAYGVVTAHEMFERNVADFLLAKEKPWLARFDWVALAVVATRKEASELVAYLKEKRPRKGEDGHGDALPDLGDNPSDN